MQEQLFIAKAMAVSWMYSSCHCYHALASDCAMTLDEHMCKPPFLQPNLHQHDAVDSPVHAAYRACDWLARPCWLTMPRPVHLSVPPLMLRSSLSSVSRGLVYIDIPGRTCLHELFIGYEQVTAWVARFSFKLEANYHQPPCALNGSMGRRTSRRHYSLVKFK